MAGTAIDVYVPPMNLSGSDNSMMKSNKKDKLIVSAIFYVAVQWITSVEQIQSQARKIQSVYLTNFSFCL